MKKIFIFILIPVFLTTAGEFILKFNINALETAHVELHPHIQKAIDSIPYISIPISEKLTGACVYLTTVAFHPQIALALACMVLGGVLWVVAMSKFELSFLYPFLSINYVAIVVGSQFILGESVSLYRYLSIVLIMIGLFFISKSPYSDSQ